MQDPSKAVLAASWHNTLQDPPTPSTPRIPQVSRHAGLPVLPPAKNRVAPVKSPKTISAQNNLGNNKSTAARNPSKKLPPLLTIPTNSPR